MGRKIIDLTGLKFGRLTVLSFYMREGNRTLWICECECGNEKIVPASNLCSKTVLSCGCLNDEGRVRGGKTRSKEKYMIGKRFGRLLVLERVASPPGVRGYYYNCLCDCDNYSVTSGTSLINGKTKSCGCYGAEQRLKSRLIDITGQTFGKWTVLKRVASHNRKTFYLCKCQCERETEKEISGRSLKEGKSLSCGCWVKDKVVAYGDQFSFNDLYLGYKSSAKARNLEFDISKELFKKITSSNCFYCNTIPVLEHKRKDFQNRFYKFNGVDRRDNNKGYVEYNIVPCCKNCNKAKQGMPEKEFLNWAEKIYQHLLKEGII